MPSQSFVARTIQMLGLVVVLVGWLVVTIVAAWRHELLIMVLLLVGLVGALLVIAGGIVSRLDKRPSRPQVTSGEPVAPGAR